MRKILMTKYGFVRWPEEDFSDDGNRFYCFRAGKCVRVSKLVSDGQVYLSARIDGIKLPYEIYGNLPHYKALDALNGVSMDSLTDTDLEKLYADCLAYEQEYLEAERTTKYPTIEEITEQCRKVHEHTTKEFTSARDYFNTHATQAALTLAEYEWQQIRDYLSELAKRAKTYDSEEKIEEFVNRNHGTSYSFNFCAPTCSGFKESYYYKRIYELINRTL